MAKGKSKNNHMSDELIALIKVTPEQTEEFMKRHNIPTIYPKLEGVKKPKGSIWCCYCNEYLVFTNKRGSKGSYKRCPKCNISTEDFHIKMQNNSWGKIR